MDARDGIELRCSAIVIRQQAVLLIHRTYDGADGWVLPGGTPRQGESTAACTRREVREETGLRIDPARVALVLEVVGPDAGPRTLDIVFAATESAPKAPPQNREPGMEPLFVQIDRLHELDRRPPLAGHLRGMLGHGRNATPRIWPTCGARTAAPPGSKNRPPHQARGSTYDDPAAPHR
jgi:8-oxo-dGTP diphosphatase